MKKIMTGLVLGLALTLNAQAETLSIGKTSQVNWVGKKVIGSSHSGTMNFKQGKLELKDGKIASGEFVVNMNSMDSTDLEGEWEQKLLGHLKSDDFFSTQKYPESKLVIEKVNYNGKVGIATGKLTIKGETRNIQFPITQKTVAGKVIAETSLSVDRTNYGIKYGSGKFFKGLGDKMISDSFDLKVKIEAELPKKVSKN